MNEIEDGNRQSAASLLPMVHEELGKMACCQMAREVVGNTLSPNTNESTWLQTLGMLTAIQKVNR